MMSAAFVALSWPTQVRAAESRKDEKSGLLSKLSPTSIFNNIASEDRHVLEAERPVVRVTDERDRHIHPIYFPPNAPPLGVELSLRATDARVGAPPELAPHAFEPFYAPLSTRLVERSLTRKQEDALAAYVNRKATLVRDLRGRLEEVATVGPELRLLALEEFAARQTLALAALEREADGLRKEFFTRPMSSSAGSWYEWRSWRLGRGRLDLPREQTLFFEGQLLRAAAFYQDGLTPAQRLLLRESAIELESVVFPDQRAVGPSVHEWFWFFSPHLARVHLPEDLPSDLQERIAEFREEKEALKTELRDVIYDNDRTRGSARDSLATLASAQTPRLEALERQAEAIRRRLAIVAPLPVPALPPALPPALATTIDEYTREKTALERDLGERVRRAVRHMQVPVSYEPERSTLAWHAARLEAIDQARARFRRENAGRIDALKEKLDAIRTAVEAWAGPIAKNEASARGVTGLFLNDFFARRSEQQGRHECHLAVFEPGLSSEQRRLLFQAGMVALNLPLPGPEEQPTALPGTLLK